MMDTTILKSNRVYPTKKVKKETYWVVVRQGKGEKEWYDLSTKASNPNNAREFATWNEKHEIGETYWKANPKVGIAKIEVLEVDRVKW